MNDLRFYVLIISIISRRWHGDNESACGEILFSVEWIMDLRLQRESNLDQQASA